MYMHVRVVTFGPFKDLFGADAVWHAFNAGDTVSSLLRTLVDGGRLPAAALRTAAVAINEEYASRATLLEDHAEVAILPPVSGGASSHIALTTEVIDSAALVEVLKAGEDGAVVVFDGVVRNNTRGRRTLHLDYEAYDEMALKEMRGLCDQALDRFAVRDIVLVHRLGRLVVGETSVLIGVASAHRGAAFDACRWLIDTLKKTVPIWKREQFEDGVVWADGEPFPEAVVQVSE